MDYVARYRRILALWSTFAFVVLGSKAVLATDYSGAVSPFVGSDAPCKTVADYGSRESLEGPLVIVQPDDFLSDASHQIFIRDTRRNQLVQIWGVRAESIPATALMARATGMRLDADMCLDAEPGGEGAPSAFTVLEEVPIAAIPSPDVTATEVHKVLIMLLSTTANLQVTDSQKQELLNTIYADPNRSVDGAYRESSFGKVGFTAEVVGPFALTPPTTCRVDVVGIARAVGLEFSSYHHLVATFVDPATVTHMNGVCLGVRGVGQVGGPSPRWAWAMYYNNVSLFMHEIGHNFGLQHGARCVSATCDYETPGYVEYGDYTDPMGYFFQYYVNFNAIHRIQVTPGLKQDWTAPGSIQTITGSGRYKLFPLTTNATGTNNGPTVIKFAKSGDKNYFLSYRAAIGLDRNVPSGAREKLNIHFWNGRDASILRAALGDGQTLAENGYTFRNVQHNADGSLGFDIDFPGPPCTRAAPTISVSPNHREIPMGSAGQFLLALTNNDNSACSPSQFVLLTNPRIGLTTTLSAGQVSIAPGATAALNVVVSATTAAIIGPQTVAIQASDPTVALHSASAVANMTVKGPPGCVRAAPLLVVQPLTQSVNRGSTVSYAVSISNRDNAACPVSHLVLASAAVGAGLTTQWSRSTVDLAPGQVGAATLSIAAALTVASGPNSISAQVSEPHIPKHTASATVGVTINAP